MTWVRRFQRIAAILVSCVAWSLFCLVSVSAQSILPGETHTTNPKDRPIEVTASVVPQDPPPAPILVEPTNNRILRSGLVLFEWEEVEHIIAIDHYELSLNGKEKYGSIEIYDHETEEYRLRFDPDEGLYSLQLKSGHWLPDGVYTWKVRVVDVNGKGTDSTTWTFTVDSTPPPLIVTEIDDDPYAISATDPTTFPAEPIRVFDRSPLIRGKSETASELQVVVRYPDGSIWQTYTTIVHQDGSFSVQFGALPLDTIMHLTFTAIDPASNSTVLDAIDLVYRPREIVIPVPDIFPVPVTIRVRIPGQIVEFPDIDIPDIFEPEEDPDPGPLQPDRDAAPALTPTEQIFTRPVQPLGVFIVVAWLGLGWYVCALFWQTGNAWKWFRHFVVGLIQLWIFRVGHEAKWRMVRRQDGLALPFVGYTVRSFSSQKEFTEHRRCTSLEGWGREDLHLNALTHVQSGSKRFVYAPGQDRTGEKEGSDSPYVQEMQRLGYVLDGEDFLISERVQAPRQADESSLILPTGKPVFLLWQVVHSEELRRWQGWLPQIGLAIGVLSALWLAYLLPTWWSFGLLVFLVWIGFRDAMLQLHKKMSVYTRYARNSSQARK